MKNVIYSILVNEYDLYIRDPYPVDHTGFISGNNDEYKTVICERREGLQKRSAIIEDKLHFRYLKLEHNSIRYGWVHYEYIDRSSVYNQFIVEWTRMNAQNDTLNALTIITIPLS